MARTVKYFSQNVQEKEFSETLSCLVLKGKSLLTVVMTTLCKLIDK